MSRSSIAQRIAAAKKGNGNGNNINPGKGVLIVTAMKDGGKPEFFKGDTYVCEFKVESCTGFPGMKDEKGQEKPVGNPVGSTCAYIEALRGDWVELAYGRVKEFFLKLTDTTEEELAAAAAERAKNPNDPAVAAMKAEAPKATWSADDEFAFNYDRFVDRKGNAGRGFRIAYSTVEKTTGKDEIITIPVWETIKQTEEEVAAQRAALDSQNTQAAK